MSNDDPIPQDARVRATTAVCDVLSACLWLTQPRQSEAIKNTRGLVRLINEAAGDFLGKDAVSRNDVRDYIVVACREVLRRLEGPIAELQDPPKELPHEPEEPEAMRARLGEALAPLYTFQDLLDMEPNIIFFRRHVFDTKHGLRFVVYRESDANHPCNVIRVSCVIAKDSWTFKTIKKRLDEAGDNVRKTERVLHSWAENVRERAEAILGRKLFAAGMTGGGIPHFICAEHPDDDELVAGASIREY